MENIEVGMFLDMGCAITREATENSYAVVCDPESHLAVLAVNYEPDCFAALQAHVLEALQNGMNAVIPTKKELLALAEVRKMVKPALKKLGVELPKGQVWSKTFHDDCSYFTVDLRKACVHYAMPEESWPMILLVKF